MLKLVPNSQDVNTRQLMSQTKFYEGYSRWSEEQDRYETWEEAVTRVMNMHRETYKDKMSPELSLLIALIGNVANTGSKLELTTAS